MTPYVAGIDLGTCFTAAAVGNRTTTEMINLGSVKATIPTIMVLNDGAWVFGESAADRVTQNPSLVARNFKGQVGDRASLQIGCNSYWAEDLCATFVGWVLQILTQRFGQPPSIAVLTHPMGWTPQQISLYQAAVEAITDATIVLISEHEAAAINNFSRQKTDPARLVPTLPEPDESEPDETVCIYDLGGGSFQTTVFARAQSESPNHPGVRLLSSAHGSEGGNQIDDLLSEFVLNRAGIESGSRYLTELEPDEPALVMFRRAINRAVRLLSEDTGAQVNVILPDLAQQILVTQDEFKKLIAPHLARTMNDVIRGITAAGRQPGDVSQVLPIGGSSHIPLVTQMLSQTLGRPVTIDGQAKNAIALGAARIGTALLEVEQSPPATAPRTTPTPQLPATPMGAQEAPGSPGNHAPGRPLFSLKSTGLILGLLIVAVLTFIFRSPIQQDLADTGLLPTRAPNYESWQVTDTIEVGARPNHLLPLNGMIWVTNRDGGTVSVIDPASRQVAQTIDVGENPGGILAVDRSVWVNSLTDGSITVIDTDSYRTIDTIAVGVRPNHMLRVGDEVWVTNYGNRASEFTGSVSIVNASTRETITTVPLGGQPNQMLGVADSVWVTGYPEGTTGLDGTVSIIEVASHQVTGTITVGTEPNHLWDVNGLVWVSNGLDGTISVIDSATRQVVDTISLSTGSSVMLEVKDTIWVTNQGNGTVSVIDAETRLVSNRISLDTSHEHKITITGGTWPGVLLEVEDGVWVANNEDETLAVIDIPSGRLAGVVAVGRQPVDLVLVDDSLWVANQGENTVSVIEQDRETG